MAVGRLREVLLHEEVPVVALCGREQPFNVSHLTMPYSKYTISVRIISQTDFLVNLTFQ